MMANLIAQLSLRENESVIGLFQDDFVLAFRAFSLCVISAIWKKVVTIELHNDHQEKCKSYVFDGNLEINLFNNKVWENYLNKLL